MRALLVIPLLAGCLKQNPDFCRDNPDDQRCGNGSGSDGGADGKLIDVMIDAPGCIGSGSFQVCPGGAAVNSRTLSGPFDTAMTNIMCHDVQLWSGAGQTASCFFVGQNITIQSTDVTGPRPLVVVATGDITITGELDVASHVGGDVGPNALSPGGACGTFGNIGNNIPNGGGAGASFGPMGGMGGNGGGGASGANAGGTSYAPLQSAPGTLRGGCRGQTGGSGQGGGGLGGFGGGAIYLVANGNIIMGASAIINASGAGGGQAGKTAGGGGGGSGGMIVLHANQFMITSGANVVANGGSGSTGGNDNGGGQGTAGNDPNPLTPMTAAQGPTTGGGDGGDGFAQGSPAGPGVNGGGTEGGGGGGGGGGYIQSNKALTGAGVSPTPNMVP